MATAREIMRLDIADRRCVRRIDLQLDRSCKAPGHQSRWPIHRDRSHYDVRLWPVSPEDLRAQTCNLS